MRLHPRREQGANVLAYRTLSTAHARAGDEAAEYLRRVLVSCLTGEKWGRSWQWRGRDRRSWRAPDSDHEGLNKTRHIGQVNKLHRGFGVARRQPQVADTSCASWRIAREETRRQRSVRRHPGLGECYGQVTCSEGPGSWLRESTRLPLTVCG